jgi:hypothetical protein
LPKDCQEKKLESTTLMVSADNDESLILGEEMIWIGQIADMRNRVPNDGSMVDLEVDSSVLRTDESSAAHGSSVQSWR